MCTGILGAVAIWAAARRNGGCGCNNGCDCDNTWASRRSGCGCEDDVFDSCENREWRNENRRDRNCSCNCR